MTQIRPLTDVVHFQYSIYLLTYLLTYSLKPTLSSADFSLDRAAQIKPTALEGMVWREFAAVNLMNYNIILHVCQPSYLNAEDSPNRNFLGPN